MSLSISPITAASASISGTDAIGTITLVAGTAMGQTVSATVTYAQAQGAAIPVFLTWASQPTGLPEYGVVQFWVSNNGTASWQINLSCTVSAPLPGTSFTVYYQVPSAS